MQCNAFIVFYFGRVMWFEVSTVLRTRQVLARTPFPSRQH